MSLKNLNQKGFTVIEGLLILVILAAIGGVGYYVYQANNDATDTQKAAQTNANTAAPHKQSAASAVDVQVISASGTVSVEKSTKLTSNKDQLGIIETLSKTCTKDSPYLTVNSSVFTDSSLFVQDGKYATIDAGCNIKATSTDQFSGSGLRVYLHEESSGKWVEDASTQMGTPLCKDVDSKGYPASVIPKCYEEDGTTTRAPKQ